MGKFIDRTGIRYGRLLVVRRDGNQPASNGARVRWLCVCDCGQETSVTGHALSRGDTTSCGCLARELSGNLNRTHGLTRTPTYRSWQAAKERCHNPKSSNYPAYGGAGIEMHPKWRTSFESFLEDMGERPHGTTLDRLDQCKGYEPGNVQWATPSEQSVNRGSTRLYRWRAGWMTTREIAEAEDIPFNSLRKVVSKHRTIQDAVAYVRERKGRSGLQNLRPD